MADCTAFPAFTPRNKIIMDVVVKYIQKTMIIAVVPFFLFMVCSKHPDGAA